MTFSGFGAVMPLDYGHPGHDPEHSLLLISDDWSSLVQLLEAPFKYIEAAKQAFSIHPSIVDLIWDVPGPLTIILDPLTSLTRASADALSMIAEAWTNPSTGRGDLVDMSVTIKGLAASWQNFTPAKWRNAVMGAFTPHSGTRKGVYIVEFAFVTRVIVVRYLPPVFSVKTPRFYNEKVTSVTFSDFLNIATKTVPRNAFMHFDLLPNAGERDYTHSHVALMKAQFAVDYITNAPGTLQWLCNPSKFLDKGTAKWNYFYGNAKYGNTFGNAPGSNLLEISPTWRAEHQLDQFPVTDDQEPLLVNSYMEPTVILESVDPWGDGWIWSKVPLFRDPNQELRIKRDKKPDRVERPKRLSEGDGATAVPCVLIYITVNGQGQWTIDPSSALVKNYVAPTLGGN